MAKFHEKGKSEFLKDSIVYLIIGLVLLGIEKVVQVLWVHSLFSRGIGALFMVYLTAAVMNALLNYVGSYGGTVGFIGFAAGTGVSLVFVISNLSYGVSHHHMFNILSCISVPMILYAAYSDHYASSSKTSTEHVGTAAFLSLILVLGLGIADACIKKTNLSMIISLAFLGVLFVILLAVWIPRYIKQGTLPFSTQISYKEEDMNSAIYHLDFPANATIRQCRDIIADSMKHDHLTRNLGKFVADYKVSAPYTDTIVIELWYREKDGSTKMHSDYFHSRNVLNARLRAMTEDCPYRVTWDVRDVEGNFAEYLSPTEW